MSVQAGIALFGNSISIDEVSEALRNHFPKRDIFVNRSRSPSADNLTQMETMSESIVLRPFENLSVDSEEEINMLRQSLELKNRELKESQEATAKAIHSVQTLHKQQQALYDEFVLLRERYDEQKTALVSTLWTNCAKYHPDLREIPEQENPETFAEDLIRLGNDISVGDTLGEGQFATVKTCTYPGRSGPKMEYALKIIKKERITSFTSLRRISNEIENLKLLDNPHIVIIDKVIHTQNNLYIITEKGGYDLFEFFDEHPFGVPEKWAIQIMVNILKGVLYCHSQGICHRDLKPENILVTFDTRNEVCVDLKLCDFGLSTKFSPKEKLTDFCGSPGFFAPEMIAVGSYYGDKADVWSIGCILLELLLGHEKFCDAWMTSFDYEILQNKAKFTQSITQTLDELPSHLNFSTELNSFVLQFLQLKTSLRPTLYGVSKHPWLEHALDDTLEKLRVSRLRLEVVDGGRGMMGSQSLLNLQDFGSAGGGGGGMMSASPSSSNLTLIGMAGQQVDIELLKSAFNNMSEKERAHIEEYILSKNGGGDSEGGRRQQHQLVLPPIEPATPNIGNARKILKKGNLVAGEQITSGAFFNSPSISVTSFSPISSPVPMISRGPKSPRNALPGLAEDRSISFSQHPRVTSNLHNSYSEDELDLREDDRRVMSYSLTSECDSEAPQVPPPLLKSNTESVLRGNSP